MTFLRSLKLLHDQAFVAGLCSRAVLSWVTRPSKALWLFDPLKYPKGRCVCRLSIVLAVLNGSNQFLAASGITWARFSG